MKKTNSTAYYLGIFLVVEMLMVGVMLCFFSHKEWWSNWMVTPPNLFMILGALFCPMMKKNLDQNNTSVGWLFLYKGIKISLAVIMMVIFIFFGSQSKAAFILITAIAYFLSLIIETYCQIHYSKRSSE